MSETTLETVFKTAVDNFFAHHEFVPINKPVIDQSEFELIDDMIRSKTIDLSQLKYIIGPVSAYTFVSQNDPAKKIYLFGDMHTIETNLMPTPNDATNSNTIYLPTLISLMINNNNNNNNLNNVKTFNIYTEFPPDTITSEYKDIHTSSGLFNNLYQVMMCTMNNSNVHNNCIDIRQVFTDETKCVYVDSEYGQLTNMMGSVETFGWEDNGYFVKCVELINKLGGSIDGDQLESTFRAIDEMLAKTEFSNNEFVNNLIETLLDGNYDLNIAKQYPVHYKIDHNMIYLISKYMIEPTFDQFVANICRLLQSDDRFGQCEINVVEQALYTLNRLEEHYDIYKRCLELILAGYQNDKEFVAFDRQESMYFDRFNMELFAALMDAMCISNLNKQIDIYDNHIIITGDAHISNYVDLLIRMGYVIQHQSQSRDMDKTVMIDPAMIID